jgi:long-chain acyl-CoA synthetase
MSLLWPILRNAMRHPLRTAVVDDRSSYSYAKLGIGAFFLADDIRRRTELKHVGIMLPTSGAFPIALLGAWIAGKVAIPLNYLLSKEELAYVMRDADIDTVITARPMLDFLVGEETAKDPVARDRAIAEMFPDHIRLRLMEDIDFKSFPTPRWPPTYADRDVAVILYTSGTSGRPKGVMLTHGNLDANVRAAIEHAALKSADTFLGVLPQFHSFGLTALTLMPLFIGARIVYSARFVPRKIIQLIQEHKPDIFMGVPSMYGALLSVKNLSKDTFSSIRLPISGGEPLPQAVYDAFLNDYGMKILEGYGLTETSPISHWSTPTRHRLHSVGQQLPCVRTFIVDDNGNILGDDQEGEIILSGSNIMKGYYKLPDQTDHAIFQLQLPGGDSVRAFRTGDIGKIDADGFLYITGRKKEMLIIGGENVFPREIEEVLNKHPMVKDSAVIGKADGMRGEVAVAYVEVNDDHTFDDNALRSWCRENLAQFKVPREIHAIDQLPRSPTGKILRRKLKE